MTTEMERAVSSRTTPEVTGTRLVSTDNERSAESRAAKENSVGFLVQ